MSLTSFVVETASSPSLQVSFQDLGQGSACLLFDISGQRLALSRYQLREHKRALAEADKELEDLERRDFQRSNLRLDFDAQDVGGEGEAFALKVSAHFFGRSFSLSRLAIAELRLVFAAADRALEDQERQAFLSKNMSFDF